MSYTPKNNFNLQMGKVGIGKKGFRKKILADVACCDNLKGYEYYGGFPLETSLEFSRDMAVYGGCPNFSWEVVNSVYFTFAHATTAGRTNTVNADPTTPIDAEELAIVEDNCGHKLVFVILYCGGGISIIPYPPIIPDPPDDPPYDLPWPPNPPVGSCNCGNIAIGYTTQQMLVDEEQDLTVEGGKLGCTYEYKWAIISGGGVLSADHGMGVRYYAPSANMNCEENATITLSIREELCDTLVIAINQFTGEDPAYIKNNVECYSAVPEGGVMCRDEFICNHPFCWRCCCEYYRCDNVYMSLPCYSTACWSSTPTGCSGEAWCGTFCGDAPYTEDIRTEAMKALGCCPAELL